MAKKTKKRVTKRPASKMNWKPLSKASVRRAAKLRSMVLNPASIWS